MTRIDRDLLARRMAAMADDRAMVVPFLMDFGVHLEGVVRRQLSSFGRHDLARDRDEVAGLAVDVAFVLQARARSWDPDRGVLPWVWAARAVATEVARLIGHARAAVDIERLDEPEPVAAASVGPGEFGALADRDPTVALLRDAIGRVARARDAEVHIQYTLQQRSGDRSPSETVAAMSGLSAANVRQINHRVRRRLLSLVESDPRYRPLRDLAWVTPADGAGSNSQVSAA